MFEGRHLARVARVTHDAFPTLNIRTLASSVEIKSLSGFDYLLHLNGTRWFGRWGQQPARGPSSVPPTYHAARGEDLAWSVVVIAEALLIRGSDARLRENPLVVHEAQSAVQMLRSASRAASNPDVRHRAEIALETAGLSGW